jgi:hypothetical protein
MPKMKAAKNKSTRARRSGEKRQVVVEERTTLVPKRHVVAVRSEPVTLSRALGEAAVMETRTEPEVTTQIITTRRKRA